MERLSVVNSEGKRIVGILHTPDTQASKVVIIAHGFTSNKDRPRHIELADALAKTGIAAFRIDFPGSGESDDREITIRAQVKDLGEVIGFLCSQRGYSDVGVVGESLGGVIALEAFDEHIKALVLWAPVTSAIWTSELTEKQEVSLKENGYYIRSKDGKDFKVPMVYVNERNSVDQEKLLSRINIPVLIVHGTADNLIPITESERAMEYLPEGSRLEKIQNWGHGDHIMDSDMETIIPITVGWFSSHL